MMMHHDSRLLWSRGSNYGLLNQIELLRRAGAVSLQVLMPTPAVGSKLLESTYTSGQVFASVGGKAVRPRGERCCAGWAVFDPTCGFCNNLMLRRASSAG